LKNRDMLRNIYRNIVKNGCNIVNNLRGRLLPRLKENKLTVQAKLRFKQENERLRRQKIKLFIEN